MKNENDSLMTIRDTIAIAMDKRVLLRIRYVDRHGKETVRQIRPDSIRGNVLVAYCMSRQDTRTFVISRIQDAFLTETQAPPFVKPESNHETDVTIPQIRKSPTLDEYYKTWVEKKKTPEKSKGLSKAERDEIIKKLGIKREKTKWSYWDIIGLIGTIFVLFFHEKGDSFSAIVLIAIIWIGIASAKSKTNGGKK